VKVIAEPDKSEVKNAYLEAVVTPEPELLIEAAPAPLSRPLTTFDVVVIGAGSGGVSVARGLADAGRSVALIASNFVGGYCPYVACMPSKSLLRSARARREALTGFAHGAAGGPVEVGEPRSGWTRAIERRDETANQRDDSAFVKKLEKHGIAVVRGFGSLAGPGQVKVGDQLFSAERIVIDTGSVPIWPEIPGLDDTIPTWTSEEALTSSELPERLLILGAGPIGCELAQVYATFGSLVTVVDSADRPVPHEDLEFGVLMRAILEDIGVEFVLGAEAREVRAEQDGLTLELSDGRCVSADRLLVAVGRRPATEDLGLDSVGLAMGQKNEVHVDEHGRAAAHIWAVGDVTAVAPYTHTANRQAQIVLADILHRPSEGLNADAIPRAVFTDPPLAATGLTEQQARERGLTVRTVQVDLSELSRAGAEGEGPLGPHDASGGLLKLIADVEAGVLVGAGAIGPEADAWISEATLAIQARIPLSVLGTVVHPFPSYAEAFTVGYQRLLTPKSSK